MFAVTIRLLHCFAVTILLVICGPVVSGEQGSTPAGAKTGLIPRKVLFGNPDKANARISPDGKQLSFLAPVDGVMNVWVGPIDKPEAAKPVTQDKKRGIRSYNWTYTNQHLLYNQDQGGDENWHGRRLSLGLGGGFLIPDSRGYFVQYLRGSSWGTSRSVRGPSPLPLLPALGTERPAASVRSAARWFGRGRTPNSFHP